MRTFAQVKTPITVPATLAAPSESQSYIIPDSHYVMAAPGVSQLDSAHWRDPLSFEPSRWVDPADKGAKGDDQSEQVDYGFGAISSGANSAYLPFGAGRHRCVGEQFAYVQLGTVLATIIRHFDLELAQPLPGPDYTVRRLFSVLARES